VGALICRLLTLIIVRLGICDPATGYIAVTGIRL
jgi:hypothetical protein